MIFDTDYLPNERRFFVHKKLLRLGSKALGFAPIPGAGVLSGVLGSLAGSNLRRKARKFVPTQIKFSPAAAEIPRALAPFAGGNVGADGCFAGFNRDASGMCAPISGMGRSFAPQTPSFASASAFSPKDDRGCVLPFRWSAIEQRCAVFLGEDVGPNGGGQPTPGNGGGAPGRPGSNGCPPPGSAVLTPGATTRTRLRCKAGYVLGRDNLCYFGLPRNSKWRKWRPGRKAMFTGGDLNAIALTAKLAGKAEDIFRDTNPSKKAVARNYRANWRKPLKK